MKSLALDGDFEQRRTGERKRSLERFVSILRAVKDNQLQKRIAFWQGLEGTIPEKNRTENFTSDARNDWQRQIMTIVGEPATFKTMCASLITDFPFYRVRNGVSVPGSMRLDYSRNF